MVESNAKPSSPRIPCNHTHCVVVFTSPVYSDSAYNKSIKRLAEDLEETEAPRIHDTTMNEEIQEEDRELEEPQEPVDPPQEKNPHKRNPAWVREIIQGVE